MLTQELPRHTSNKPKVKETQPGKQDNINLGNTSHRYEKGVFAFRPDMQEQQNGS